MEDCILLSRRGELCPMRLQQLRRANSKCVRMSSKSRFFLTRHDRQNDPDILRLHQTNRWLQIPIPALSMRKHWHLRTYLDGWVSTCILNSLYWHACCVPMGFGKNPILFFFHAMDVLKLRPQSDSMIFRLNSVKICVWICIGVPVVFGMFI